MVNFDEMRRIGRLCIGKSWQNFGMLGLWMELRFQYRLQSVICLSDRRLPLAQKLRSPKFTWISFEFLERKTKVSAVQTILVRLCVTSNVLWTQVGEHCEKLATVEQSWRQLRRSTCRGEKKGNRLNFWTEGKTLIFGDIWIPLKHSVG